MFVAHPPSNNNNNSNMAIMKLKVRGFCFSAQNVNVYIYLDPSQWKMTGAIFFAIQWSHNWPMIDFDKLLIHSQIVLFLSFSKYEWNEIPVNKSSRISAINRITNFSCVNPSRRNIRTHGIWIYDALLNQGFAIVFF